MSQARQTVAGALDRARAELRRTGVPEPRAESELLLARLMGTDRGVLLARRGDPLDPAVAARYAEWVRLRTCRVPLQHLTGEQEFYGLSFKTDARALVPRPETEGLVDAVLALRPRRGAHVADLGTGSGCIAVALSKQREDLRLHALDRSPAALALARENAARHGVERTIEFVERDLVSPPGEWLGRMDVVVANPPYVREEDWKRLEPEVREHDPRDALVPGPTGYEAYEALVPIARELLRPRGHLLLELGYGQATRVSAIVAGAGFSVEEVRPDLRSIPRVLVARRGPGTAAADAERSRR